MYSGQIFPVTSLIRRPLVTHCPPQSGGAKTADNIAAWNRVLLYVIRMGATW